ncbi:putative bacteriophage protein [Xanthobacter versatilis]|uniref:Putative bacteriophage protein n=1 Tax=Xanthobacter autotrophicus (strain ATCC BAA-1158 / Py2) TaxID=78245 RepID=A7ILH5_XANP2|nr:putative bacteriophage protein [Xanthobacter autotrophicus Py2]
MNVTASIVGTGGSFSLGYGSDNAEEGISVSMLEDKNTMMVGADGGVMHSLHAGRAGSITVRLLKTSPVNKQLMDLYRFQTSTPANHGANTLTVRDTMRGDVVVAQKVAFRKIPDNSYAKAGNILEWVFDCGIIDEKLG